jgi:prepilin-type N-terminal cleavage/methylation domain-containing protein
VCEERSSSGKENYEGGFTVIELIIVFVILGIMMAVAYPRLSGMSSIDLQAVAMQVQSDIRYTRESAMSKYETTSIIFYSGGNTYSITSFSLSEEKSLPVRSRAQFDSGDITFTFNSSGEPTVGVGEILEIAAGGIYKGIKVEAITGRPIIQ